MRIKSRAKQTHITRTYFQAMSKCMFFIVLLLTSAFAYADNPRWKDAFASANGKYELRYISGSHVKKLTVVQRPVAAETRTVEERYMEEKWSLAEKKTGKVLYTIEGDAFSTQTLLVSDDGLFVVAVDDFSERIPVKELSVLAFYNMGKLRKFYTISDLLQNLGNVHFSISHFLLFRLFPRPTLLPDFKLAIETNEWVRYVFDVRTGDVLSKVKRESTD